MARTIRATLRRALTATMEAFADFSDREMFGGTLPKGVNVESFRKGVALGGSLRNGLPRFGIVEGRRA